MSAKVRSKTIRAAALAAAALLTASIARADPVTFSGVNQTALAQDDAPNQNMHTRNGFGTNGAMVQDGTSSTGIGTATSSQTISYPGAAGWVLSYTADLSAMATGPTFGGGYSAFASGTFNVPFSLSRAQDIIYNESPSFVSTLNDSVGNFFNPGTSLLRAGSYTLNGSASVSADAGAGMTDSHSGGYDVTVKFVTPGDVNQDGTVNFSDVLTLIQHYGNTNATLADGDFNTDGTIDFGDVLLTIQNYGFNDNAAAIAAAPAPEPAAGALAALGLSALARRNRKRTGYP